MVKFCPKCGKRIKTGVFCVECNPVQLVKNIKDIKVWICADCQRFFLKNKWKDYEEEIDAYKKTAKENIDLAQGAKLKITPMYKGQKIKRLKLFASDKQGTEEEHIINVTTDRTMCPSCSKKSSNYIAGTLQIRNLSDRVFEELDEELKKAEDNHVHILKMDEKKESIDIDMTNQRWIERIAKNLQSKFGGKIKIDYRLQTRDHLRSKDVYRITANLELPKVLKGEAVLFEDKPYLITAQGKEMSALNLISGKHIKIDYEDKYLKLETKKTTISTINPHIEALDPETYQSEPVKEINKIKKPKIGKEIRVLSFNGALYHF